MSKIENDFQNGELGQVRIVDRKINSYETEQDVPGSCKNFCVQIFLPKDTELVIDGIKPTFYSDYTKKKKTQNLSHAFVF